MTAQTLQLPIELEELRRLLRAHGVVRASVFGSYARGEAREDSDLDLLVELDDTHDLFDLGGLQYALQERVKHNVDLTTKLHPRFEPYITPDLVSIL